MDAFVGDLIALLNDHAKNAEGFSLNYDPIEPAEQRGSIDDRTHEVQNENTWSQQERHWLDKEPENKDARASQSCDRASRPIWGPIFKSKETPKKSAILFTFTEAPRQYSVLSR